MIRARVHKHAQLFSDIASIYGVQMATYVLPLVTVPYLSRVLGPGSWGLIAMAQSFSMYGGLAVEYGFVYSGTRDIARARSDHEIEQIIAGILGAKAILAVLVSALACAAYLFIPLFHQHPLLLSMAMLAEIVKAGLPIYYFYGINRVVLGSLFDISARLSSAAGIFIFVHGPVDAWKVFALQALGAFGALCAGQGIMIRRYGFVWPSFARSLRILRDASPMFMFRSAHNFYVLGNAFILGLFSSPQTVGYYAGAEKINSGAVGMLSPLTTVLYPRAASLVKSSPRKAARLTTISLYIMTAISFALTLGMWFGSTFIVRLVLGKDFVPSGSVLKILSLRAPMVAITNVLGFQWLLALGLERAFQNITLLALVLNVLFAAFLAPRFSANGMAWAVVVSQTVAVAGIYLVLRRRRLHPHRIQSDPSYA